MRKKIRFGKLLSLVLVICITVTMFSGVGFAAPNAQWIWDAGTKADNTWMAFRKTVSLANVPSALNARIAVDSKYWLYINDALVVFEGGLKRGPNPKDGYVDNVDIAPYLKAGENTIAVLAVYHGKGGGFSASSSGKGGFFFEAVGDGVSIVSDDSWKAKHYTAYKTGDPGPNYRLPESNIFFYAQEGIEMEGWYRSDFDDTTWKNATTYGQEGVTPWGAMYDRPIPLFSYDEEYVLFDLEQATTEQIIKTASLQNVSAQEYVIETKFKVDACAFALVFGYQDAANFNMWQIFGNSNTTPNAGSPYLKPHLRINGNWTVQNGADKNPVLDWIEPKEMFTHWYEMKIVVQGGEASAYVDGKFVDKRAIHGDAGAVGFRADSAEGGTVEYIKVTSIDGETTYIDYDFDDNINVFDGGSVTNGRFSWKGAGGKEVVCLVNGEKATKYGCKLPVNVQFTPYLKVNDPQGANRIDLYTDKTSVAQGPGLSAAYFTKSGVQAYESLIWLNGDYMYFEIPQDVEVLELGYRQSGYNATFDGSFQSDDAFMDQLWIKARDTLYVTMRDNFMDCPDRERAQWWGDAVNEMQMAFYALSPSAGDLTKKGIGNVLGYIRDNRIPTVAPISDSSFFELPAQSMAGVYSFYLYYQYSGDSTHFEEAYPKSYNYLMLFNMGSDGVVQHRGGSWDWSDWGSHSDQKLISNCWYYIALDRTIKMGKVLGMEETDPRMLEMRARMDSIENNFDKVFWNEGGFYRTPGVGITDDRGNALAVFAGLASQDKYPAIRNVLMTTMHSSPYMEKYADEALYMMGYDKDAMARIKTRYKNMVESDLTTLWEFWDPNSGTQNHAWTGGPLTMMGMYAAGVSPVEAGYQVFKVAPQIGTFKSIDTVVPTVKGEINVKIDATVSDELILSTTVPMGTKAIVGVPLIGGMDVTTIYHNDEIVWSEGVALDSDVTFIESDAQFAYFETDSDITFKAVRGEVRSLQVDIDDRENFTLYVDSEKVVLPYSKDLVKAGTSVNIKFVPKYVGEYVITSLDGIDLDDETALEYDIIIDADYDIKAITEFIMPDNLARGKKVTASNGMSAATDKSWGANNLTDGIRMSNDSRNGFTTVDWTSPDRSDSPQTIEIDLGDIKSIDRVYLYPRTSAKTLDGKNPHFPKDFTIQVSDDGVNYIIVHTVTDGDAPDNRGEYNFDTVDARYVKIVTTKCGVPAADEGGDKLRYRVQLSQIEVYGPTPVAPVDKRELQSLINQAGGLVEADYTEESWEVLANALAQAQNVLADDQAEQETVDNACEDLDAAIQALVKADGGEEIEVSKIKINASGLFTLSVKKKARIPVTIEPSNATDQSVKWISTNPNIFTVDADGNITPHKQGTATLTAQSSNGLKSTIIVRITA